MFRRTALLVSCAAAGLAVLGCPPAPPAVDATVRIEGCPTELSAGETVVLSAIVENAADQLADRSLLWNVESNGGAAVFVIDGISSTTVAGRRDVNLRAGRAGAIRVDVHLDLAGASVGELINDACAIEVLGENGAAPAAAGEPPVSRPPDGSDPNAGGSPVMPTGPNRPVDVAEPNVATEPNIASGSSSQGTVGLSINAVGVDGSPAGEANVEVFVDGQVVCRAITDSGGVALCPNVAIGRTATIIVQRTEFATGVTRTGSRTLEVTDPGGGVLTILVTIQP